MQQGKSAQTSATSLSQAEAARRLQTEGTNELPVARRRDLPRIVLEVLREPMLLLLVSACAIYFMLGDVSDALMLLGFVCVVIGITIYQEHKTERVLETLRDLTSPRARVLRDGVPVRIAGREVVRGDILLLAEGDRIAADSLLLSCNDFSVDESLLTGEAMAVRKTVEESPNIFSGTLVVQGHGTARVLATGARSEIGKIGRSLQTQVLEATPLQLEISRLVRRLAVVGILLCLILVLLYGITRSDWLHGLLSGITLAMSILPEEYPVVLTVFMAMGAWRIARHNVLTRRVHTVEALGSTTVLCVDKTGTLTQNRMAVQQLAVDDATFTVDGAADELPEAFHKLVEFAILASQTDPFDPMEKAIHALGARYLTDTEHLHRDWGLAHEYGLSRGMLALSHVWRARGRDEYVVAAKGAPEAVADLCHLDATRLATLETQVEALAAQGMRVLGVARALYRGPEWPQIQHDFGFEFAGLIGLADPLRPSVPDALRECATAGIRVVMITGDYPATAAAIARAAGLDAGSGDIITGPELAQMDEAALHTRIRHCNLFARMAPEQKLRLVNALKAQGEVVAMTGDGVNDAPALQAAHIGIAMGGRGTDVAREAAALVLLDDDFSTIVHAVRLGRGIFNNLRKAMGYIFAVHLPIIGLSLVPLLLGWPPVFAPVHIVFLEMIINPACSIALEAEPIARDIMRQPPRDPRQPLFGARVLVFGLAQGIILMFTALLVLGYALHHGSSPDEARALTFSTLVIGNLGLILVNRSWRHTVLRTLSRPNPALWWILGGAFSFLLAALYLPWLREVFHFAPLTSAQFALSLGAGIASVLWFELYKLVRWR